MGGFETADLLEALDMVVIQLAGGRTVVENQYVRSVRYEGNVAAQRILEQVLEVCNCKWRAIEIIPEAGCA